MPAEPPEDDGQDARPPDDAVDGVVVPWRGPVTPDSAGNDGGQAEPPAGPPDSPPDPAAEVAAQPVYDLTRVPGDRQPILPGWLASRENFRGAVRLHAGQTWHRSRYHGLRLIPYLLRLAGCILIGVARIIGVQLRWWWVTEQSLLRSLAAASGDSREWRSLHREVREVRTFRGLVLATEAVGAAALAVWLWLAVPRWGQYTAAAAATVILAWLGSPEDRPIISAAIISPKYEQPSPEMISKALGSLGISKIDQHLKAGRGIDFISPVMQAGPGWACQLDLPHGVTAEHIIAKRSELASGLRRPLSATWPEAVPAEHEGRLALWVGFHDISKTKPPKYPLVKTGATDIFGRVPYGVDPRGRMVDVPLFECNWLIGAAPGQGKTNAVRGLAAAAVLDPLVALWIHELAGKGDLEPFAQVCHRYTSGLDDEAIAYAAESARLLRVELERRSLKFKQLPREAKPDGSLTRELATALADLRPIVAVFDEAQNLFLHPIHGAQAANDLAHVIRLGRAYGIIVVLATQRPDKDCLPTAIRGIVTCRFCLKVNDYDSNDMVLGTGSYKAGYDASRFRARTDAGLGWLKADGPPQIVRTYYLDLPASARIAARARAIRERAGLLTGYALGEDFFDATPRDVLADLLAVFGEDNGMHWAVAADRLAERFPDRWHDATAEGISAAARAVGVPSVDTRMTGASPAKGCRRVAVERSIGQR